MLRQRLTWLRRGEPRRQPPLTYLHRRRRLVGRASTLAATSARLGPTLRCRIALATALVTHNTPYSLAGARSVPTINGTGSLSASKQISTGWRIIIIQAMLFSFRVLGLCNFLLTTGG